MDGVILSGDRRSACLFRLLSDKGVDALQMLGGEKDDYSAQAVHNARFVILPAHFMGGIVANGYHQIAATRIISDMDEGAVLFCGASDKAMDALADSKGIRIAEFQKDESYLLANAHLTAEGALMRCIEASEQSLFFARVVIVGSGRIARALHPLLRPFTPHAVLLARNRECIDRLRFSGADAVAFDAAPQAFAGTQWIFNTVPAPCIDPCWLHGTSLNCHYMELASAPYGIMREQLPAHMVYRLESGLPGRISPQSAAKAMLDSLERNWEDCPWKFSKESESESL